MMGALVDRGLKRDIGKAKAYCKVCFNAFSIGNNHKAILDSQVSGEKC